MPSQREAESATLMGQPAAPRLALALALALSVGGVLAGGCAHDSCHQCCGDACQPYRVTSSEVRQASQGREEPISTGNAASEGVMATSYARHEPPASATTSDASGLQPATPEALPPASATVVEQLTLDQAIQLCLINDPRIRAGLESINQAGAEALTASLKPNPTFFTDIQLLPLVHPFTVTRQGGPPQQDFQLGYPIDWFLFGKRAAAMASAAQGLSVSQAEYENLIRQRVTSAGLAFYDVLETESLLRLARQDVDNLEQIAASIEKVVPAARPEVELNRVRLALLTSRRTLRDAQAAATAARSRLNALVGGSLTNRPFSPSDALDQQVRMELPAPEAAYAAALASRPDLNALRWKVEQARSNMLVEERRAYPSVTMSALYTRQYQLKAIGFPDADSWGASIGLPLPIWDRNQGNRIKAESVTTQSLFALEAGELELWSEIESVLAELTAARDNAAAVSEQELQLAEKVLSSIRQAYGIGTSSLLDLLDAQRSYRETYRAYTTTRANFWRARLRYQSAIGQQNLP